MIAEKQKNTNIGVGAGFLVQVVGRVLAAVGGQSQNALGAFAGIVLILVGLALFIWGCVNYSQGKGYSPWLGLLGLFSCIGLIVLVLLPDRFRDGGPPPPQIGGSGGNTPGVWPPPPSRPAP